MRLILQILTCSLLIFHPVHLSVTNVEYNTSKHEFLIRVRLFVDDFQKILNIKYGQKCDFRKGRSQLNDKYLKKYLSEHLDFVINGKSVNYSAIHIKDYQVKDITLWVDLWFKYRPEVKTMQIKNTLMFDLYPDQRNLLIFTYKGEQKAYQFGRANPKENITL